LPLPHLGGEGFPKRSPFRKARKYPFEDLLPYITYHSKVFLFVFESISPSWMLFRRDPPSFTIENLSWKALLPMSLP
jgi:hypothetical protein